jgi:hypothetical protein
MSLCYKYQNYNFKIQPILTSVLNVPQGYMPTLEVLSKYKLPQFTDVVTSVK